MYMSDDLNEYQMTRMTFVPIVSFNKQKSLLSRLQHLWDRKAKAQANWH